MKNGIKSIHLAICVIIWLLWFAGVALIAIARFGNLDNPNDFFFNIVHPYNRVILLCSLIPVEPIICVSAIINDCRQNAGISEILMSVLLFLVTAIFWVVYISLYILWTGGV